MVHDCQSASVSNGARLYRGNLHSKTISRAHGTSNCCNERKAACVVRPWYKMPTSVATLSRARGYPRKEVARVPKSPTFRTRWIIAANVAKLPELLRQHT